MNNQPSATGSIRGFTNIDLGQGQTAESIIPSNFSLADLLCRINDIRSNYDPDSLDNVITTILSHIQNYNNPHDVTLTQTGADVLNLVYQEWLANGNTGTVQEFYSIFFQTTDITTVSGTTALTASPTNIVTVSGVQAFIAQHNADPNAHAELLNIIMPGTPPTQVPTTAFDAQYGSMINATTTRSTPITILDQNGNLVTVPANQIAVDYSNNVAAFPLFGQRTNTIYPSNPNLQPGSNVLGASNTYSPYKTLKVGPDGLACMVLKESSSNAIHGYKIGVSLSNTNEYTDSVFIYPLSNVGGITLYLDAYSTIAMTVSLVDYSVTTSGVAIGYVQVYPNGWIRIGFQYVAPATASPHLIIAKTTSTIVGTGVPYQGTSSTPMFGLFGLQHTVGCGLSPYIPTTTVSGSHDSTQITITATLGNAASGLLSVTYNHPSTTSTSKRSIISLNNNLVLSTTTGQINLTTNNLDLSSVSLYQPDVYNEQITTVASFAPSLYKLGTTGSTKISVAGTQINLTAGTISIILGSTSTPLNGSISSLILYPVSDTNEEIEFLVGEA